MSSLINQLRNPPTMSHAVDRDHLYTMMSQDMRLAAAEIAALRAENERLREQAASLPGDMHWCAEDPEYPQEDWSAPIDYRWERPGTVHEVMCAKSLPSIFVTERVLTVDEDGDPDETEAAWFETREEAEGCYPDSLAAARAALNTEGEE